MKKATTFGALVLASGLAMAQAPAFSDADTNGDGALDEAEATAAGVEDFGAADADANGSLSEEEYTNATAG